MTKGMYIVLMILEQDEQVIGPLLPRVSHTTTSDEGFEEAVGWDDIRLEGVVTIFEMI
jgi:hypothetical protein